MQLRTLLLPALVATLLSAPVALGEEPAPRGWLGFEWHAQEALRVGRVFPASPAARAGLAPGDRLVAAQGQALRANDDYTAATRALQPGQTVRLTVAREGQRHELSATLSERPANPWLPHLESVVEAGPRRTALLAVQPACVRVGGASGVNLTPRGLVLTCAHNVVPPGVQVEDHAAAALVGLAGLPVRFPDGTLMRGHCLALDRRRDLALLELVAPRASFLFGEREAVAAQRQLPFARLAAQDPPRDAWVACIGTPSQETPERGPFHVSLGKALGLAAPGEERGLGALAHDAWTYWGHSGAPLFDAQGRLVGVHNTWDPRRGTRHAVPVGTIRAWLAERKLELPPE